MQNTVNMLDVNAFKAAMVKKGYSQAELAKEIGISPRTLSTRIKTGDFGTLEIRKITEILDIDNPIEIFFAH